MNKYQELKEAVSELIKEWKEEADFLSNNSVGSDILVGATYELCAEKLEAILKDSDFIP